MSPLRETARRTFRALSVRNFRLYATGQLVSVSGTWMHTVALAWLVLKPLHGNGVDVGIVTGLQFLPMLLSGSWGGLIADRFDKRRLLYATQSAGLVLALVLGVLTLTGAVELWQVYLLALGFGFMNLFDNPARQTFVFEMAGPELLPNAISLNSVLMNSARVVGPAVSGVLIVTLGIGDCFVANAISYVAVIWALTRIRPDELYRRPPVQRAKGQVREGLRYAWSTPDLRNLLLVMAVVGIFAFNFTTTLPLLAKSTFHGGAGMYSIFTVAMGSGAIAGGLLTAHRSRPSPGLLALVGICFGAMMLVVGLAPTATLAMVALVLMGACYIAFIATANATLQLRADPAMRGRVMALYSIAFLGSTPIGGPIVGAVSEVWSPRAAVALGAVATLAASVPLALHYLHQTSAAHATIPSAPGSLDATVGVPGATGLLETPAAAAAPRLVETGMPSGRGGAGHPSRRPSLGEP